MRFQDMVHETSIETNAGSQVELSDEELDSLISNGAGVVRAAWDSQ